MALRIVRYVLAWPRFIGWLWVLLACAFFFAHRLKVVDDAVLTAEWRPWWAKRWRYSTTIGAGMIFQGYSRERTRTQAHERVHVRQTEDLALAGAIITPVVIAATGSWWPLLIWPAMLIIQTSNFLGAVLRGGDVYRDAEHERSAYAQTDEREGKSWQDEQGIDA